MQYTALALLPLMAACAYASPKPAAVAGPDGAAITTAPNAIVARQDEQQINVSGGKYILDVGTSYEVSTITTGTTSWSSVSTCAEGSTAKQFYGPSVFGNNKNTGWYWACNYAPSTSIA